MSPAELWRQRLLALIEGFLRTLPRESREQLGPAAGYLESVEHALERVGCDEHSSEEKLEALVDEHMSAIAFKALLRPDRPLDDPWVIDQAAGLCEEVLRSRARAYDHRYGDLVDPSAAKAIGWFSLITLSKRMWSGEEIKNPHGYLRRIIEGDVGRLREAAINQGHPGAAAFRRIVKEEEKRLRQEQPDLDALERRAVAAQRARDHLGRFYNFLECAGEESLDSIFDKGATIPEQATSNLIVEEIDHLVAGPAGRYTKTDRDAWARFKRAGFRGADVDWTGGGCSRHTGSQRLLALFRKLRRDLEDWR
jgi:hypothetical protein